MTFDQYDNYTKGSLVYKDEFVKTLKENCRKITEAAEKHGKLAAISETGMWVPKADGSDHEGLLISGNPMARQDWYGQIGRIAKEYGMPYYLVWVSTSIWETHIPYSHNWFKHEMVDDFMNFYKEPYSIFASETHFYDEQLAEKKPDDAKT